MALRILFPAALWLILLGCSGNSKPTISRKEFTQLLETIERGWNEGNARLAADCFTLDAIYTSPPNPRVRRGRQELFDFFGGEKGRPKPITMQWHHIAFDETSQVGMGEYTFTYEIKTHGIVTVRVADRKIANWREIEKESPLDWDRFVGSNRF